MARTNKFPGRCGRGKAVAAGAGLLVKAGGRWAAACRTHEVPADLAPPAGWQVYRDGDRAIIGRSDWQTCYSMTYGVADAYTRAELRQALARAAAMNDAEALAAKRVFWTDARFEAADRRGMFGAAW